MTRRPVDPENVRIGRLLQIARENAGLTQQDMVDSGLKLTKNHLSASERGQNRIAVTTLLFFCSKLNLTPNEILGYRDEPPRSSSELEQQIAGLNEEEKERLSKIIPLIFSHR